MTVKANNTTQEKLLPCPFCGGNDVDLGFSRGIKVDDTKKPIVGAGCWKCGAVGPTVEFKTATGYDESSEAWNTRLDHIIDANKKGYPPEQVKAIALAFYDYLPQHDSIHTESCFDAWFEKYGSKL